MLRKLVINDWIHVSFELVLEHGKMACTCLGDICWEVPTTVPGVQMQKNRVPSHQKKNFVIIPWVSP